MFFESFLAVIVTKKAACENARTQVALDFEGFWIFSLPTLGGGRSILLSYGCTLKEIICFNMGCCQSGLIAIRGVSVLRKV